jgi:hypothetical protein
VAGGTPYEEHAPPPSLRRILLCPWSLCVDSDDHTQLVLPDGCVDIVFIGWSPPIIAGPATRPSTVRLARGTIVVGARFRPGWAPAGLGAAALGTAGPRRGPARGGMGSESGLAPREGRASDERARQAAGAVALPRSARRRQRGRRSRRRRVRPRTRRGSARARPRADGRAERTPPSTAIRRRGRLRHEDVSTHRALSARPGGPSSAGLRRGRRRQGPGGRRRSGEGCPEISGTSRATAGARGARDRAASARPAR